MFSCPSCSGSSHNSFCFIICFIFRTRSSYFFGWRICCALVPGTLASDLPTLDSFAVIFLVFSVSQSDHRTYLSRMKNLDGHWVYCWLMSLGRKNVLMWRQRQLQFPGLLKCTNCDRTPRYLATKFTNRENVEKTKNKKKSLIRTALGHVLHLVRALSPPNWTWKYN